MSRNPNSFNTNSKIILTAYDFRNIMNFIKNNLFKKGTLLGLFTLSSAAGAQTIYQCSPCPNGLASQPGTISASGCFNPVSKSGSRVIFDNSSSGWSGTLQPGWYRISLRGSSGSGASAGGGCSYVSCYGGNGGDMYYVFYVSSSASGEYSWNGGSPKFVVKENGKWKLDDNFGNKINNIESKTLKSNGKLNCFNINSGKKRNSIAIFISTNFDNDNKIDIKDSLSSEIYTYNYRTFYRTLQSETYKTTISDTIIIINKKFDKDKYKIYINGNPYKIFEKKK